MTNKKQKEFKVTVKVTREYLITMEIKADDEDEAEHLGLTEWREHDFGLGESIDWDVVGVKER